jgi:AhpD family alkylhydroperoxidase
MAYLELNNALPGILVLLEFRKETGGPLSELAQALLRGPSPLSAAERELIAAYVSNLNRCAFCFKSHAAAAGVLMGVGLGVLDRLSAQPPESATTSECGPSKQESNSAQISISPRLEALLAIAAQVTIGERAVEPAHIASARAAGATELEIHDAVLIAAAFCMFNRYVDGLGTFAQMRTRRTSRWVSTSRPAAIRSRRPRLEANRVVLSRRDPCE